MPMSNWNSASRHIWLTLSLALFSLIAAVPQLRAQEKEDWDAHKLRIDGFWFYSQPSGSFQTEGRGGSYDFQADVGFNSYSTFTGGIDWKFTRKNHLFFKISPFNQSKDFVTNRTIVFRGQTFPVGLSASAHLRSHVYAPGYRYDIIRRKRGHLGIVVQFNLFDVKGTLSAAAQVNNGVPRAAQASSSQLLAPIPVAGPDVRFYPLPNSNRLFVTGNLLGMYFFGYGNFVSTFDTLGVTLTKHLNLRAGYSLGTRLEVKTKTDRVGLNLTQKGPVVGLEFSF
jgi:hypothetical protein